MSKGTKAGGGGVAAVARAAGVSPATVSRAYNSPDIVKDEVRQKIFEVAADLNYSPNAAARALRSKRTHIIGAAIPTLDYAIFARMVNEFQSRLRTHGATTIVMTTGFDNTDIYDDVRLLIDRGAEALLLVGAVEDDRLRQWLQSSPIPVVTTYSSPKDALIPAVGFDNYQATTSVVNHLIELGHSEFAMIAADTDGNDRQRTRIAAYRDRLEASGLNGRDRIISNAFAMQGGAEMMGTILTRYPDVTAVVCNSDVFAIGALSECRRRGLSVPDDISVVGCDDFDFAELLDPALTTISVPAVEMGKISAERLWLAITNGQPAKGKLVETELVVRSSTAPPPSATRDTKRMRERL